MMPSRAVPVVLALVMAAACGSTVQTRDAITQPGGGTSGDVAASAGSTTSDGGNGLGPTATSGGTSGAAASGGSGTTTTGITGRTGGTGRMGTSGGAATGGKVLSSAPGVTATSISLGLYVYKEYEAVSSSIGHNLASIDFRAAWGALVDETNKGGGIAGRKVLPVFHTLSVASDNYARDAEAACVDWTQDHHVFAALAGFEEFGEGFYRCMDKAGAVVVGGTPGRMTFDGPVFSRYPRYVAPFAVDLNRHSTALVDGMARQGYFDKGAKIGLVAFDQPYFDNAIKTSFIPALARHGLALTDTVQLPVPQGAQELGQLSNEATSAAFKFNTEGITHVLFLDIGGYGAQYFMKAAESQRYRPRYGLTSQSGGSVLASVLGSQAKGQLHAARMIGWFPVSDVYPGDEPAFAKSRTLNKCLDLMRRKGIAIADGNAASLAVMLCDWMWSTKAIVEAGGRSITRQSFAEGLDRLGSTYQPAQTFVSRVSGARRDGLGAVAPMAFVDACTCFRYTGSPYAIPG